MCILRIEVEFNRQLLMKRCVRALYIPLKNEEKNIQKFFLSLSFSLLTQSLYYRFRLR